MKEKERDEIDDLFRSKLQDFEVEQTLDDWELIADRLDVQKSVPFRKVVRYWVAAAVISLFVLSGGIYWIEKDQIQSPLAGSKSLQSVVEEQSKEVLSADFVPDLEPSFQQKECQLAVASVNTIGTSVREKRSFRSVSSVKNRFTQGEDLEKKSMTVEESASTSDRIETKEIDVAAETVLSEKLLESRDIEPLVQKEKTSVSTQKWSLGMGGGGVSAGTSSSINAYALKNSILSDKELVQLNSPYFNEDAPKTNVDHKTPISVGLGVGYQLNDRFSLLSGLTYTFLSSEWNTEAVYKGETKQKLHFIGIPLSLSYKIAEWKRICFYASAGAMAEVNVSGRLSSKIFVDQDEIRRESKHIRMKEWLWSVNGCVGASYPLWRFVSLYAEVGADYYFDNGSEIETIRSEKPFNVSLQAGFRLGF